MSKTAHFYAHGKLLLSGEYLVLKGAKALAIPTKYGQKMEVATKANNLSWRSLDSNGKPWFTAEFNPDLSIINASDDEKARRLITILRKASELSQTEIPRAAITTTLEFPNEWGLGSSSTLVYLIAKWFKVDPMNLFFGTSNGSGYDVACAGETAPILYSRNERAADWKPVILPKVYNECLFIYLGKKQSSDIEVNRFNDLKINDLEIQKVSQITSSLLDINSTDALIELIKEHEGILSSCLELPKLQNQLFNDFEGAVKSLGAWGGDFCMAIGNNAREYFQKKGYSPIFSLEEIML